MNSATLIVLIPAAGSGSRFGSSVPKQYSLLAGRPMLAHTIERLASALPQAKIAVVLAPDDQAFAQLTDLPRTVLPLYCGGARRAESVLNGLRVLGQTGQAQAQTWIAVHDAARPCVPLAALNALKDWIDRQADDSQAGALLAVPLADTLKEVAADGVHVAATHDRSRFWRAQTPQCFRFAVLQAALSAPDGLNATDEAQAVERWCAAREVPFPTLIASTDQNLKITYPDDLQLAAAILALQKGE